MTVNKNRKFVQVPDALVDSGQEFGRLKVEHYGNGGSPMSRSRSGNRGAESDPVRQAHGIIGEVACAIYLGLDPIADVNWDPAKSDSGYDVVLPSGLRIDVKTTLPPFKLIWSRDVNDLYFKKRFDVLISVSIEDRDWSRCWIEGWITKNGFYQRKRIADGMNCNLELGTWFVEKHTLSNIDDVLYLPYYLREPEEEEVA